MNQNQPEPTLEESVKQVMQTLPPPIRDYLSRGKYTPVAKELMAKYGLRIDQGGILERGMMLLLMGIEDPAEFSKALIEEAKLDQQTVNGIMQDVNTEIFIPLRDEMRKEPMVAPKSPVAPAVFAPAASKPIVASPATSAPQAPLPRVLVPVTPARKPALRDVLESVMKAPLAPAAPILPTPASTPAAPSAPPQRAVPLENLPSAPRAPQATPIAPAPESRTQPPKQSAPAAPAKPYFVDPYREPLDEK